MENLEEIFAPHLLASQQADGYGPYMLQPQRVAFLWPILKSKLPTWWPSLIRMPIALPDSRGHTLLPPPAHQDLENYPREGLQRVNVR
jgi:hypothetical protein